MSFLNKQQDVIDIKLTRFGKNLLARGSFRPVYYQFFDDGILYDSERAGIAEEQNTSEVRIKQTPTLETQPVAVSVEESFDVQEKLIEEGQRGKFVKLTKNQDPLLRDRLLKYALNSYRGSTQDAPHFNLKSHGEKFTGNLSYLTSSYHNYNIPQIQIDVNYNYTIDRNPVGDPAETMSLLNENIVFNDGTGIYLEKKDLIIELEELCSLYGLENFEIEIFESKGDETEDYIKIEDREKIFKYFDILVDQSVPLKHNKRKGNKGFYLR